MAKVNTYASRFIEEVRTAEGSLRDMGKPITRAELSRMWGVSAGNVSRYEKLDIPIPAFRYIEAQERYGWNDVKIMGLFKKDYPRQKKAEIRLKLEENEVYQEYWENLESRVLLSHPFPREVGCTEQELYEALESIKKWFLFYLSEEDPGIKSDMSLFIVRLKNRLNDLLPGIKETSEQELLQLYESCLMILNETPGKLQDGR